MPSTILDRSDRSTDREALHRDPNLVLYRTRAGFTAVTQLTSSEGQVDQRFFDVNAPGRDLLALVDGHRSLADIATEYCRSTDLDVDPNRSWIDDYFTAVRERGVVFAGEPHDDPALKEIGHGGLLRPVHLTVEITDACNLECQHCYLEASPAKQARMTFAEFQRVVGAFQENQGLSIELTGGEVFCNPEWKPILELALEQFSLSACSPTPPSCRRTPSNSSPGTPTGSPSASRSTASGPNSTTGCAAAAMRSNAPSGTCAGSWRPGSGFASAPSSSTRTWCATWRCCFGWR